MSLTAKAAEAARRISEESDTVRLNQEAWSKLNDIINNPSEPTDALRELMKL